MKQSRKSVLNIKASQKRIQRLHKEGLTPQALLQLQSNLSVFYSKHGKKQPTNLSGISLRGLNTAQINELNRIVNVFMKNPLTTKTGIKEQYNKEMQKLLNKNQESLVEKLKDDLAESKNKTQTMLEFLQNTEHVKASAISRKLISSEQLQKIWRSEKEGDITYETAEKLTIEMYELLSTKKGQKLSTDAIREILQDRILDEDIRWSYFGHY